MVFAGGICCVDVCEIFPPQGFSTVCASATKEIFLNGQHHPMIVGHPVSIVEFPHGLGGFGDFLSGS